MGRIPKLFMLSTIRLEDPPFMETPKCNPIEAAALVAFAK